MPKFRASIEIVITEQNSERATLLLQALRKGCEAVPQVKSAEMRVRQVHKKPFLPEL